MATRKKSGAPKSVLEIDWAFFGELCRALALKVWHSYQPDLVIGIARAGVLPGAVVASILRVEFASMSLRRTQHDDAPALIHRPTQSAAGKKVLLVDSTCESGDTIRLASSVLKEEQAAAVKTAVAIRTGDYAPDFAALTNPSFVILPWDRDVIQDGQIVVRPDYEAALRAAGLMPARRSEDARRTT
jgi:hypoxanthine phosphoribosyltransferase